MLYALICTCMREQSFTVHRLLRHTKHNIKPSHLHTSNVTKYEFTGTCVLYKAFNCEQEPFKNEALLNGVGLLLSTNPWRPSASPSATSTPVATPKGTLTFFAQGGALLVWVRCGNSGGPSATTLFVVYVCGWILPVQETNSS